MVVFYVYCQGYYLKEVKLLKSGDTIFYLNIILQMFYILIDLCLYSSSLGYYSSPFSWNVILGLCSIQFICGKQFVMNNNKK